MFSHITMLAHPACACEMDQVLASWQYNVGSVMWLVTVVY